MNTLPISCAADLLSIFHGHAPAYCSDYSVDVDIILVILNVCSNDLDFDPPAFFATHGVDPENVPLTHEDVIRLHERLMPSKCAGRSPIKMVLRITETIIV